VMFHTAGEPVGLNGLGSPFGIETSGSSAVQLRLDSG